MTILDWRGIPPERLAPVYTRERQRWLSTLGWETAESFAHVELARTTWGLPGFVALDQRGHVAGSIYYMHIDRRFEVGGVTAETPEATCGLLNAVLDAADLARVDEVCCFVFEGARSLGLELARRDFQLGTHLYLARPLDASRPRAAHATGSRSWLPTDESGAAALLNHAYEPAASRHFAPDNTPDQWRRYVRGLTTQAACGAPNPVATRVVHDGGRMVGVAIVTTLGPGTAHVAQIAVDPSARRQGLGRRLLAESLGIATAQGHVTATLLASAANQPARALYAEFGFTERAAFISARRAMRRAGARHVA